MIQGIAPSPTEKKITTAWVKRKRIAYKAGHRQVSGCTHIQSTINIPQVLQVTQFPLCDTNQNLVVKCPGTK
jgi:hypothetical protein